MQPARGRFGPTGCVVVLLRALTTRPFWLYIHNGFGGEAPSSSLVQDTCLSRMQHGFESRRGHLLDVFARLLIGRDRQPVNSRFFEFRPQRLEMSRD